MAEPIYGVDADGITHYWYFDRSRKNTTKGWSGCGQKEHGDFASFSYTIEGEVTCIGCIATAGDAGEMQGLINDLSRSIAAMKTQSVKLDSIQTETIAHAKTTNIPQENR
jgi:hypothetical protein